MSDDRIFVNPPNPDAMRSDWFGSAAAETRITGDESDFEGLAGLDEERWYVIGFDLYFGSDETKDSIYLYAVDREAVNAQNYNELAEYANREGAIPVTSIKLHDITIRTFMKRLRGAAQVHMRFKSHRDVPMYVVEYTDFPDPDLLN